MCTSNRLDIKDPAKTAILVSEYVARMKTVKRRNMETREMKLAIGDEPQTLFYPTINAAKQAAEKTKKELAPTKKALTDIDGALLAQRGEAPSKQPLVKPGYDNKFGLDERQDGQLLWEVH